MSRPLIRASIFHATFASYGDLEANVMNYMAVPVRHFFSDSLAAHYNISSGGSSRAAFELIYSGVASLFFIGVLVGGFAMGSLMDNYGRKGTATIIRSTLGAVAPALMILGKWANSIELFAVGQFIAGVVAALKVDGEQLKAHRLVLSAMSPVFEVMFSNDSFQETRDHTVRIEDFAAKPCRAMIDFAYTECVDCSIYGDCKRDVLKLAEKYLIVDLKHLLETLLVREMSANDFTAESFAELARLADSYSCKHLKKACVEYLSANPAVVSTPQWGELTETRGDLTSELIRLAREGKTTAGGAVTK